jgi:hypothetical protein
VKKPVNKGLIIGIIAAVVILIAAALLFFVFDVFGLKGGKAEDAAEQFMKAYTELDANAIVETMAPELRDHISELGMGDSIEDVQSSFDMLKGFGVEFNDMKIGEARSLDADKTKSELKDEYGIDVTVKEAAKVKCSVNMHMEFMGESMDQPMNLDLTMIKQGSKWYVANVDEEDSGDIDTTEATTEDITEATTEAVTEATTEAVTETTTEATTEAATEATTEPKTVTGGIEQPGFEKYNIKTDMKLGTYYQFDTIAADDSGDVGTVDCAIVEYSTDPLTQEQIDFGKENDMNLDGYVRKYIHMDIKSNDDAFTDVGYYYYVWIEDYYSTELADESFESLTDSYDENYARFKINYKGEEKYVYYWIVWNESEEDGYYIARPEIMIFVPDDYEGLVCGVSNYDEDYYSLYESYDEDNFHLFRLD